MSSEEGGSEDEDAMETTPARRRASARDASAANVEAQAEMQHKKELESLL